MGLDLEMFEGEVPPDLVCSMCGRVLEQPEISSCQHVFCGPCLRSHHARPACPTCGTKLDVTSHPAPAHIRLRLLDLRIRCGHRCGQVLPLSQLPHHVSVECPNTPVSCQHKGCRMEVRRCEQGEHSAECEYRPVTCEACGYRTVFRELVLHQSRKRCVEMRLKNQLIQAVRSSRKEVKRHQKHIDRQQIRLEQQNRRTEMEHHKRMNTARRERQMQQNYNITDNNTHNISTHSIGFMESERAPGASGRRAVRYNTVPSIRLASSNPADHQTHRTTISREMVSGPANKVAVSTDNGDQPSPRITTSRERLNEQLGRNIFIREKQAAAERLTSSRDGGIPETTGADKQDNMSKQQSGLFLTSTNENDDLGLAPPTRDQDVHNCRNCKRKFREARNKPNSCRWHAGPIIELFGGTCFSCGRLDYQSGCMMGFHEL